MDRLSFQLLRQLIKKNKIKINPAHTAESTGYITVLQVGKRSTAEWVLRQQVVVKVSAQPDPTWVGLSAQIV